jgi:hypothetical protein
VGRLTLPGGTNQPECVTGDRRRDPGPAPVDDDLIVIRERQQFATGAAHRRWLPTEVLDDVAQTEPPILRHDHTSGSITT